MNRTHMAYDQGHHWRPGGWAGSPASDHPSKFDHAKEHESLTSMQWHRRQSLEARALCQQLAQASASSPK